MKLYQSTFPCETAILCPLHAAAPALLAALEATYASATEAGGLGGAYLTVSGDTIRAARAAIAKAKGETK
jgi:hypothetical protein